VGRLSRGERTHARLCADSCRPCCWPLTPWCASCEQECLELCGPEVMRFLASDSQNWIRVATACKELLVEVDGSSLLSSLERYVQRQEQGVEGNRAEISMGLPTYTGRLRFIAQQLSHLIRLSWTLHLSRRRSTMRRTSVREAGPEVREAGGKGGKESTTAAQARRALVSTLL
jgi:hypothetical protein